MCFDYSEKMPNIDRCLSVEHVPVSPVSLEVKYIVNLIITLLVLNNTAIKIYLQTKLTGKLMLVVLVIMSTEK